MSVLCWCCREQLPDTAKVKLCPACFQATYVIGGGKMWCPIHRKHVDPKEVTQ